MTNVQPWLAIGIPSISILLTWLANNSRLSAIDARFDRVERRIDAHDKRFDEVIANGHRDALQIMSAMTALHERVAAVEAKQTR